MFPNNDALPGYSPQGNRIAFISDRSGCCNDLFEINANGGGEKLIDTGLSNPGIVFPAWGTAPLQR
ncbi:MAG TPA: hypothetical protein VH391_10150 [Solirubrobacterales bacterium]